MFKEPIFVFVTVILLEIPAVKAMITSLCNSIPLINNKIGYLGISGVLAAGIFYALQKNI